MDFIGTDPGWERDPLAWHRVRSFAGKGFVGFMTLSLSVADMLMSNTDLALLNTELIWHA
jgi:hypothetical protein